MYRIRFAYTLCVILLLYALVFYGPIYIFGYSAADLGWQIYDIRVLGLTTGKIAAFSGLIVLLLLQHARFFFFSYILLLLACRLIGRPLILKDPIKSPVYQHVDLIVDSISNAPKVLYRSMRNSKTISDLLQLSRPAFISACLIGLIAPIFLGLVLYESFVRYSIFHDLTKIRKSATIWLQDNTLTPSPWDEISGNKPKMHPQGLFKVNTEFNISVIHPSLGPANFQTRTNNVGLLSDKDYIFARDHRSPEYRIVILGDSMTGPTTSTYQWVDTLEDLLNNNPEFRKAIGGKAVRIYNLGWIGAGFNTFADAWKRVGQYFDPDYVLLNYIEIDLERLPKGVLTDDDAKVKNAVFYLNKIIPFVRKFSLTLMPTYGELGAVSAPTYSASTLLEKALGRPITVMRELLHGYDIPAEVESWFSLPHDAHYSDRGGEIYARALATYLAKEVSGLNIDFSQAKSRYGDQLLKTQATRMRQIYGPLARLGNDEKAINEFLDLMYGREISAKVFAADRLYSIKTLLGEKFGANIPYDRLTGIAGFEGFTLNSNQDITLNLLLSCVKQPITIDNPDCYHHRHFFIGKSTPLKAQ